MKIQILIGCVLVLMLQVCASVNGIEDSNNFGKCVDVIDSIWEYLIRHICILYLAVKTIIFHCPVLLIYQ